MTTSDSPAATNLPVLGIAESVSNIAGRPEVWSRGFNAVMLGVDFTGREDIIYRAMMDAKPLLAEDAYLGFKEVGDGHTGFVYQFTFDDETDPVSAVGVAGPKAISWFQAAPIVWLTTIDSFDTGQSPLYVMAPNDPSRWRTERPDVAPFTPAG